MIASGISIIPDAPVAQVVALACQAEARGFTRCWMMDEGVETRDVYISLASVAAATRAMQVGTGVTNAYTRHAGVTATSIATLDEVSGGRAFLGIGAGGSLTLGPLALERRKPLTAVAEMVTATRRLLAGERLTFDGEFVQFNDAYLKFARPDIEIWIAGRGQKMLTLAGKVADGV